MYLGPEDAAENRDFLDLAGIRHILNVTWVVENQFPDLCRYKKVEIDDLEEEDIGKHLESCTDFIQEAKESGTKILVHCEQGISRSASCVIAFLIKYEGMSLIEAYWHVKGIRYCVSPNEGFMEHLVAFEKRHRDIATIDPVEYREKRFEEKFFTKIMVDTLWERNVEDDD